MNTFPILRLGLPAVLAVITAGCQQQDAQMQARLAELEARARTAETALAAAQSAPKPEAAAPSADSSAALGDLKKQISALEDENRNLRAEAAKAKSDPLAGVDAKVIETSFINSFLEKKKEWREALTDYIIKGYEQPEVTMEDVKPFRTSIGIRLEQAGKAFTAQVPVTADFQGNWFFPTTAEVVTFVKQAAAGGATAAPAASSQAVAENQQQPNGQQQPQQTPGQDPPPAKQPPPDADEPVPFGGKNLIKLPPIKFPGDP